MAIYRTGKASLAANGIVTGYGTKWRETLKLIRVGATIVFASNPAEFATIIEIVSDTELRVADSAGKVVPESEYVILLHDSLTVDGLAQDVAETLRYYQGRESEFAHFIDLIRNMDLEKIEETIGKMKEQVDRFEKNYQLIQQTAKEVADNAAKVEADANVASESAGRAQRFREEAEDFRDETQTLRNSAADSVDEAKGQVVLAGNQVALAKQQADRAQSVVDGAKNEVVQSAANEVQKAAEQADRAKTEADRAASLADQFDASKVMLKDQNLADLTDKAKARQNLGVDNIVHDGTESRMLTENKAIWLSVRNQGGAPWGVYDSVGKRWVALGVDQGGTGARNPDEARANLKLDRLIQDDNVTRLQSWDAKTELRIGQDDWYVYRTADDSTAGFIALPVKGGGTGANDAAGARENLELGAGNDVDFRTVNLKSDASRPLLIRSANPSIRFEETDVPESSRAKAYVIVMDGGSVRMQENNTGSGATVFNYSSASSTITLPKIATQDINGTRDNLGVGTKQGVSFGGVTCDSYSDVDTSASGILQLRRFSANGSALRGYSRVYHEKRSDGKMHLTFHVNDGTNNRYSSFDNNGDLNVSRSVIAANGSVTSTENGKSCRIGCGSADAYFTNTKTAKYLQLKDDGRLCYADQNIMWNGLTHSGDYTLTANNFQVVTSGNGFKIKGTVSGNGNALYMSAVDKDNKRLFYIGKGDANKGIIFNNDMAGSYFALDTDGQSVLRTNSYSKNFYVDAAKLVIRRGNNRLLVLDNLSTSAKDQYWTAWGNVDRPSVMEFKLADGYLFYAQQNKDGTRTLKMNGNIECNTLTQVSDRDLKDNIAVISDATKSLRKMSGYTYTMKENGMPYAGVIAQEVMEALPEAISGGINYVELHGATKDGNPLHGEERYLGVDYAAVTGLLVQVCRESDERISKLENEVEELKTLVSQLINK